ncbi:hypothetical protein [Streptomyces sp. CAU 1734]|uniref:hypothetical protein n=1 Tax=Streptomyces sp. CAU 1734 TaxID=3140360 RepID=UPI003260F58B
MECVRHREQFGRAIGSFQAVGHRPGSGRGGPGARPVSGGGTGVVKAEAVQLHGGIGFIREHETRLPFARAASDGPPFGPVRALRARSAEPAGLFTGTCASPGGAGEAALGTPGGAGEAAPAAPGGAGEAAR